MMTQPSFDREINFFFPLIVSLMLCCCAIPTTLVLEKFEFLQEQERGYLLGVIIFVVVERVISRQIYQQLKITGKELFFNRTAELIVLVLLSKLGFYGIRGIDALVEDFQSWVDLPDLLFQGENFILIAYVVVAWKASNAILISLETLSEPIEEKMDLLFKSQESIQAHADIRSTLAIGGLWVLLMTGSNLAWDKYHGIEPVISIFMQLGVIGYFINALILLGYTHFLKKRQEWESRRIPVSQDLNYRWLAGGMALSTVVLLVSGVLPAVSTVAPEVLVNWANKVWGILFQGILYVQALFFAVLIGLSQIFPATPLNEPPPPETFVEPETYVPSGPAELETEPSLLWVWILLALIGLVFVFYIRTHAWPKGALREKLKVWLLTLWHWRIFLRGMQKTLFSLVSLSKGNQSTTEPPPPPKERLVASRTPNARIRRHYLAMVQSMENTQYRRKHQLTPKEYEQFLEENFPESKEHLDILTEAFIQARYSPETCDQKALIYVQKAWKQFRQELTKNKDRTSTKEQDG